MNEPVHTCINTATSISLNESLPPCEACRLKVVEPPEPLEEAFARLLEDALALSYAIEELPASAQQTKVSVMASELRRKIAETEDAAKKATALPPLHPGFRMKSPEEWLRDVLQPRDDARGPRR